MASVTKPAHLELPFTQAKVEEILAKYPSPVYIYDEKGIRENARALNAAFAWNPGFKEYFAVKATPNPAILQVLKEEGLGMDCSSLPELLLSQRVGLTGEDVMFTSNNTLAKDYKFAVEMGAVINLDDITHIEYLEQEVGLPELVCFRYNPGPLREGNAIIGKPEEAKYGFTREQLFDGYRQLQAKGVSRFGLHTMVASNERNAEFFVETAEMLFELANALLSETGVKLEFVNLGGGIGIPYRPEEQSVDLTRVGNGVKEKYDEMLAQKAYHWSCRLKHSKELVALLNLKADQGGNKRFLGYIIKKEYWGCGFGSELAAWIVNYCENTLKLPEVYALIEEDNEASRRILVKLGFELDEKQDDNGIILEVYKLRFTIND